MIRSAVISTDQKYRYSLYREWEEDPFEPVRVLNFVMLNPSTADAEQDDPTIRKCIGFAKHNGYNAIRVVNLFAFRATDPKDLKQEYLNGHDAVGPENDIRLWDLPRTETVVAAWGSTFKDTAWVQWRIRRTKEILEGRPFLCLKKTKDGHPWHPLYVPYGPLIEF